MDPHQNDNRVENGLFSVRYMDGAERVLNAEYNYTRDSVERTDLSGRWPISNCWSLVGRWTLLGTLPSNRTGVRGNRVR